ncbi:MAG: radical SAM/SPASM domain-containing protein [Ignavibacteria bacterium]
MSKYFDNTEITIEVTNKCAAKCVMCPREKMKNDLEVMPQALFEKIVTEAFDLGVELLDLCGYGDVFLDRGLFDKISFAKKLKPDCKVFISTTGNAMIPRYHEKIAELVDILKFSIYASSPGLYEKMMGGLDYEKSIGNILRFIEFNRNNGQKVYTIGNYILMDENAHEMDAWLSHWEPMLNEVYVWKPHNYVDGRTYRNIEGKQKRTCNRPIKGPLNVAVNGIAHVCCFDYNKELAVGDLKSESIAEVMNSDELHRIQQKHLAGDFSGLICDICDQTVKDDSVLIYHSNPNRKVGMSNSSLYDYEQQ